MPSIVPSYIAKVSRAKKHLIDLNEAVDKYAAAYPYTVRERIEGKDKRRVWRLALKADPSNTDIPVIAADAIYNLRSSLDHLMNSMVARKDRGSAMFPIFFEGVWGEGVPGEDQQRVKDRARWASYVKSLPNEAVAILKTLQPADRARDDPTIHLLSMVNRMSNGDRHRKLPIVAAGLSEVHVQVEMPGGNKTVVPGEYSPYNALQNNAKLHGIPDEAVDVQIAGIALVAIEGRDKDRYIAIPQRLVSAALYIEQQVIPRLAPFVRV